MTEEYRYFREENIVPLPIGLWRNIQKHPKKTAIRFITPLMGGKISLGRDFSYEETGKKVSMFSDIITPFAPRAISGRQERIAILMPNLPQFVFAYYGTLLSGNIAVPIDFMSIVKQLKTMPVKDISITEEILAQIENSDPALIFAADFFWPILAQLDWKKLRRTKIVTTSPADFLPSYLKPLYPLKAKKKGRSVRIPASDKIIRLGDFLNCKWNNPLKRFEEYEKRPCCLDDVARLQHTGGTTGIPKGAMLTHRNVASNIWQCREHFADLLGENEIVLGALPLFHAYGLTVALDTTLIGLGGTLVLVPELSKEMEEIPSSIEKEKVTLFPGANVMFDRTAKRLTLLRHAPKFCISGAGALNKETKRFLARGGITVLEGFGLSEASPVVSVELPEHQNFGSVGVPIPGTEVRIVDIESGIGKLAGEEGEILVRGPQVMGGYWNKPDDTGGVIVEGGWLRTGDIGKFDEKGLLYITDRLKNMIKVNGENVYPGPIEEFVKLCPAVKNCAVIGGPHSQTGEAPILFVVFHEKRKYAATELHEHLMNIPNGLWKIREIFPVKEEVFDGWTNPLGKVSHKKVRAYHFEQRGAA